MEASITPPVHDAVAGIGLSSGMQSIVIFADNARLKETQFNFAAIS
jgi:hypothetical protein